MALIEYSQYFDFDGLKNAIKEAETANKEFGATVDTVNKRIKQSYDDITKELKDYVSVLSNFNVNQKNAAQTIVSTGAEVDKLISKQEAQKKIIQDTIAANDLLEKSISDLKITQSALIKEYESLGNTETKDIARKKEIEALTGRLTSAITAQTTVLKTAKVVVDAADGSYNRMQQELKQVGISLKSLPNAFDATTGKLNTQNKEAVTLNAKYLQLTTSLKTADAGFGQFFRNVGNYEGALGHLTEGIGHFASGLLLAVGIIPGLYGLVTFLEDSVKLFNEEQVSVAQLTNILTNIGRIDALDRLRAKAHALSQEFKTFEDVDIINVFQQLIQYGKLTEGQIDQLLPVIINFSTITGQSLEAATNTILKSLEGNNRGLKQFGINIRDAKNTTEAFGLVMNELAPRVEGAAKAFGETTAGQIKKTEVQIDELKEKIGGELQPAIKAFYEFISGTLQGVPELFHDIGAVVSASGKSIGVELERIFVLLRGGPSALHTFNDALHDQFEKNIDAQKRQEIEQFALTNAQALGTRTLKEQVLAYQNLESRWQASKEKVIELSKAQKLDTDEGRQALLMLHQQKVSLTELNKVISDTAAAKKGGILGLGDPNDPFSPQSANRALQLFKQEIDREEALSKAQFEEEVAQAQKLLDEKKITEADFQLTKFNAAVQNAVRISAIENTVNSVGYKADLAKIKEANNLKLQSENEFIRAREKLTDDDRKLDFELQQQAIENEANLKIASLNKEKDSILNNKKNTDFYRHALEVQYLDTIDKLTIDSLNKRADLELDTIKKNALLQQAEILKINIEARHKQFSTVTEPQDFSALGIKFLEDNLNAKKAINQASLKDELDTLEKEKKIYEIYGQDITEIDLKIAEKKKQIQDDALSYFLQSTQALSQIAGSSAADFINTLTQSLQDLINKADPSKMLEDWAATAIAAGNLVTDSLARAGETRIANLEKEKEHELSLAGNNASAQQAINERYAKEEAKIKRKVAVENKINALFEIAINTAVGVSKATGSVAGIPLIPLIIALGAAEAALVLAQPIPQFRTGTKNAPEGSAIVDEGGPELIIDRHGNLKEIGGSQPRITYLEQGDKVFTATKTKEILRQIEEGKIMREINLNATLSNKIREGRQAEAVNIMAAALRQSGLNNGHMADAFKDAVKDIPIFQTFFDERGIHERMITREGITTYRNKMNFGHKK